VEFLNPAYPDPKAMMDEIHSLHAHALISVWPSFGPESNIFKELQAENLLLGQSTFPQGNGVRVYDPWNPRAREIFWNYMEKNLWSAGVDGWWLDATEPEHQPVRPEDYDYRSPEGTYREMRNSFPLYTVGACMTTSGRSRPTAASPSSPVPPRRACSATARTCGPATWSPPGLP
jgi:alpha-D-xyloside xylohydrolase